MLEKILKMKPAKLAFFFFLYLAISIQILGGWKYLDWNLKSVLLSFAPLAALAVIFAYGYRFFLAHSMPEKRPEPRVESRSPEDDSALAVEDFYGKRPQVHAAGEESAWNPPAAPKPLWEGKAPSVDQ